MAAKKEKLVDEIQPIKTRRLIVNIVGETPFISHRFQTKAWQELLLPSRRKNAAAREASLKHDPVAEFRECLYRNRSPRAQTLFHMPEGMIHGAMAHAAIDLPGAKRASIQRLVSLPKQDMHIWGVPMLKMDMVRNSDPKRTPDVRTRAIFPKWAVKNIIIDYKVDPLNDGEIINLLGAGGIIVGCGDWRPQKGGGHGKYRVCNTDDVELKSICASGGRVQQLKAYEQPECYDVDTEELLSWFNAEISRREKDLPSARLEEVLP